ncbi:MAG TPA: type II secretion system F family protein [Bryobacterales bacterium]|nr:type II secretion system F family protein [Bryobacterales bacterium]
MLVLLTIIVVFVATFLAAAIAVVVAWMILQRRSGQTQDLWPADPSQAPSRLLKNEDLSTISVLSEVLAHFDFVEGLKARLAEAEIRWSVGRLTAMMLLSWAAVTAVLANMSGAPAWAALVAGCAAGYLPCSYVFYRRKTRLARFEEQLPEALDDLSRALRAGHPLAAGLEMLAAESPPPLSIEIRKTFDERQLGLSWDQALQNLARRVPLMDVGFFAAAVQLQTRTGGKLGEVLGRLAETTRERLALRAEIRSIAAHGRLTGLVLTLIPVIVVAVMAVVNPAYLRILATSPYGKDLVLAAAVCLILAHFVIRRIVNIRI